MALLAKAVEGRGGCEETVCLEFAEINHLREGFKDEFRLLN